MRLLHFSDLHVHNHEQFKRVLPNGRNSRFQDCLNVVEQATRICQERDVDVCVFGGDLHHSRTKIDIDVLSATYTAFRHLSKAVKHLRILKGNHDEHTKVGDVHALEAYREIALVIDQPYVETFQDVFGDFTFAYQPHTTDIAAFQEFSRNVACDFFFFHQGLKEATVGPYDVHTKCEVSISDLPTLCGPSRGHAACFGGDYHKRQFLAGSANCVAGSIHYVGSPLQLSFAERTEEKGFSFYDSILGTIEFIPTQAPRFYLYDSLSDFRQALLTQPINREDDFLRIKCKETEATSIKKFFPRSQLEVIASTKQSVARVTSDKAADDKSLLASWIESKDPQHRVAPQDELIAIGLQLLQPSLDE